MNQYQNTPHEYDHYVVESEAPLLEWLLNNVKGTKTKIKATLQGKGIRVNGKVVTRYDYPLLPGMKVGVSKTKKNNEEFKSRYLKIVYEDRYLVVVDKNVGILSMAAGQTDWAGAPSVGWPWRRLPVEWTGCNKC